MDQANDMITKAKVWEIFAISSNQLNALVDHGDVRSVSRPIDVCHSIKLYSRADIERFMNGDTDGSQN